MSNLFQMIIELWDDSYSIKSIAEKLHIPEDMVYQAVNDYNCNEEQTA